MKAEIRVKMDNDAFVGSDNAGPELARILRHLADKVEDNPHLGPGYSLPVFDVNGNDVGYLTFRKS